MDHTSCAVEIGVPEVLGPDVSFNVQGIQGLLQLAVSNEITNLRSAVESVTELDGLVFFRVFALFLDPLLRLMYAVVVEVDFYHFITHCMAVRGGVSLKFVVLWIGL